MLNYTDITQNTYIRSLTVTEIMAIEECGIDVLYAVRDTILVHCACPATITVHCSQRTVGLTSQDNGQLPSA
jgi:hypothetical protein